MRKLIAFGALLALLAAAPVLADENWDSGVAAFKAGNFSAAAAAFQKYVELVPDAYQGHLMLGNAQLKNKDYAAAAASLQKANELKPGDPSIQLALAQALGNAGKSRDACGVLRQLDEGSLPASNHAAYLSLKSAHCGSSLADLAKMAQGRPEDANLQAAYGVAALNEGQIGTAVTALEKAVRLAPNDPKVHKSYLSALVQQARTARGSGKQTAYNKAVSSAEQLVKLDRNYDNVLLLGEMQLGAKQYAQALQTLRTAGSMKANDWLPYYYQGQAMTSLGQFDDAVAPLNKALSLANAENKRNVYRQLGFVHEKQKNYAESIRNYELAGDQGSVARVRQNQDTAQYNESVEEQNRMIEELKQQQQQLEEELENLEDDPPF